MRAVNLGVTSWIDAAGVVHDRYTAQTPGTVLVTPAIREGSLTLYARFGDVPVVAALIAAAALVVLRERKRARAEE